MPAPPSTACASADVAARSASASTATASYNSGHAPHSPTSRSPPSPKRTAASSSSRSASTAASSSISPPATSSRARRCSRPSSARCARRPPGASAASALIGVYLWRNPGTGRTTMRFAFTGTVADHRRGAAAGSTASSRTHWLSRAELQEREPQLRSPAGAALHRGLPGRPSASAARHGGAHLDLRARRCAVACGRPSDRVREIRSTPRHRRPLRRRRLRRRGPAAQGAGLGRPGALHEQLGRGRRRLLHGRAGLPGRARGRARARHPAAPGELRGRVSRRVSSSISCASSAPAARRIPTCSAIARSSSALPCDYVQRLGAARFATGHYARLARRARGRRAAQGARRRQGPELLPACRRAPSIWPRR